MLKGPCKHKALVCRMFSLENWDILPRNNPDMRRKWFTLGTGEPDFPSFYRPLLKSSSIFPGGERFDTESDNDNDDESEGEEDGSEEIDSNHNSSVIEDDQQSPMNTDNEESFNEEKSAILDDLKASLNDLIKKVEDKFDEDPTNYKNSIQAFTKTIKKLSRATDRTIHSAFHTFDKETVLTKKRGRPNAGPINILSTNKSRRLNPSRGSGPSQKGRPPKASQLRSQLLIRTDGSEKQISSLPLQRRTIAGPHSLEGSLTAGKSPKRKH